MNNAASIAVLPLEWRISEGLIPYPEAQALMQARIAGIRAGTEGELVWLVQHPLHHFLCSIVRK